ncbi:MAG: oligosaccharide flippase family protein [Lachnospiraceae bacterium]|nr:oligosaccharide flippase family protein [Lachnospiraceae bacterium]
MSKNIIIKGTLILTIAGLLTKLLGFYNRIFLTRIIGVKELGVYQLIFPIFMLAISLSCQGVATALTKHISYYLSKRDYTGAKSVFRLGLAISVVLSSFSAIIIYIFSNYISMALLKNSDCEALLRIITVSLPFIAVKSCVNAYFLGDSNPKLQGILHMFEQIVRITSAYILTYCVTITNLDASMATMAMVISEILSSLLAVFLYKNKACIDTSIKTSGKTIPKQIITKSYLQDMLPITANNLIFTIFASLEAMVLPAMLYKYYTSSDMAMGIYGIITGIVIPFLLFPATITTSLSTMLLPAISNAKATNDCEKINKAIKYCVVFCSILGIISFFGYYTLGEWACLVAFKSEEAGIILRKMCFMCPLIYLSSLFSTILNGLDKAFKNMLINIIGLIIRISITIYLVPIHGLSAYILGIALSYFIIVILMGLSIRQCSKIRIES